MKEEDKSKLVEVFTGSPWEAELVKSLLGNSDIEAVTKDGMVVNVVLPATAVDVSVLVNEKDYEAAHAAAHEVAEEKDAEIAYLKGKVDSLAAKVPSADDLTDCIQMARDSAYGYREKMEEAAASVVELADDPSSPEFTKAVKDHRNAKTAYEYAEALASRLEKIRDNTPAGEQ